MAPFYNAAFAGPVLRGRRRDFACACDDPAAGVRLYVAGAWIWEALLVGLRNGPTLCRRWFVYREHVWDVIALQFNASEPLVRVCLCLSILFKVFSLSFNGVRCRRAR